MKAWTWNLLSLGCAAGLWASALAQPAEPPAEPPAGADTNAPAPPTPAPLPPMPDDVAPAPDDRAPAPDEVVPPVGPPLPTNARDALPRAPVPAPDSPAAAPPKPEELMQVSPPPTHVVADGEKGIRLNFRNAPLELVLNHLSEAAGFIIVPEVDLRGKVDVWSSQPLTKEEAVDVLNSVLAKNGFAALRNGRTLTIVSRDEAKKRDIPVRSGSDPAGIPKSDEFVTQILPIRYVNATQLIRDLQPLLPTSSIMTANEGGNALVITDTQVNIRRMAEIVKALDTALASVSAIRVFPLKFADAKELANVVKELFQTQDSAQRGGNDPRSRFFNFFRGREGGGPPGFGGPGGDMGGGGAAGGATGGGRAPTPRVVAVADERSNSLVVSAPEDQMPIIEDLVKQVDTDVDEITELRVFRLRYADPQEMADVISGLFPSTTSTQGSTRGQLQFGGRFGGRFGGMPFGGGNNTGASQQSARLQKQTQVVAVPDPRTSSVIVSAARDLMEQIAGMVQELDADPAKKQKVFVFSLENTDPQAVQETLESLFPSQNYGTSGSTRNPRNTSRQTGNQLNTRANQTQNQGFGRSSGFGGSGFGGSSFGGGTMGR